jgi:uncharacterized protein (TIGR02246 family)
VQNQDSLHEPSPLTEAKKLIAEGNATWIEGWRKGDAAMVGAIFAEDGIQLRKGGDVVSGRAAIVEAQQRAMQSCEPGVQVTVETAQVWIVGDEVYESGKWTYKWIEKKKQAFETESGRYVTIWKRQKDGTLKLQIDIDVPLDPPNP